MGNRAPSIPPRIERKLFLKENVLQISSMFLISFYVTKQTIQILHTVNMIRLPETIILVIYFGVLPKLVKGSVC